jgi:hypothetical protein
MPFPATFERASLNRTNDFKINCAADGGTSPRLQSLGAY